MVSKEIHRNYEHTLVFAFFAGGGSLAVEVFLPMFLLLWSFFPPLGAAEASSDSESSEVVALYSDSSSEPASSAAAAACEFKETCESYDVQNI